MSEPYKVNTYSIGNPLYKGQKLIKESQSEKVFKNRYSKEALALLSFKKAKDIIGRSKFNILVSKTPTNAGFRIKNYKQNKLENINFEFPNQNGHKIYISPNLNIKS